MNPVALAGCTYLGAASVKPFVLAGARVRPHNMRSASGEGTRVSIYQHRRVPTRTRGTYRHEFHRGGFSICGGSQPSRADELVLTSGAKDYEGSLRLEFNLRRGVQARACTGRARGCVRRAAFEHVVEHPSPVATESYDRVFFR